MNLIEFKDLEKNYFDLLKKISLVQTQTIPTVIAVSKNQPSEKIRFLYSLGHRHFGENYFQELMEKQNQLNDLTEINWHFIGKLQSNKIKKIVEHTHYIHSLCEAHHAELISMSSIPVFIQINLNNESSKSGIHLYDVPSFLSSLEKFSLNILGAMAIPSQNFYQNENFDKALLEPVPSSYIEFSTLAKSVGKGFLSMGMTHDWIYALRAGATHLRIGEGIFGQRNYTR